MIKRGLLFVVSGPSGVGKDTVLHCLLQKRSDCVLSVSATTRTPRSGEQDGVDYHFLSHEQFQSHINHGEMLEWAEYAGNFYGTPSHWVETHRAAGKHVILEIEVQGALQIKQKCPDGVFVFIMPPSMDTLRQRLLDRNTESLEVVEKRLHTAETEMQLAQQYDYILVNHTVDQCCEQLSAVVSAASGNSQQSHAAQLAAACSKTQMIDFIREVCSNA